MGRDAYKTRTMTSVLDQMSVATEIVDSTGATRYVNQAFTALTGFRPADVLEQDATRILRDDDARFADLHQNAGTSFTRIEECQKADGTPWTSETTVDAVQEIDGGAVSFRIVTRRDVGHLQPDSRRDIDQDALDDIGHDLRTPLNAIIGYTEMLLEDATVQGRAQDAQDLTRVHRAGKQLQAHLATLLRDVAQSLSKANQ